MLNVQFDGNFALGATRWPDSLSGILLHGDGRWDSDIGVTGLLSMRVASVLAGVDSSNPEAEVARSARPPNSSFWRICPLAAAPATDTCTDSLTAAASP